MWTLVLSAWFKWVSNYIRGFLLDVITDPCPNLEDDLAYFVSKSYHYPGYLIFYFESYFVNVYACCSHRDDCESNTRIQNIL